MPVFIKNRVYLLLIMPALLVFDPLPADTRDKEGECRLDEVDMGDYCASLPPARSQTVKERRRVTRFRSTGMMPGRASETLGTQDKQALPQKLQTDEPVLAEQVVIKTGFSVQLGAFSTRERAESVAISVESSGPPVTVVPLQSGNQLLWACIQGPFPDKPSAIEARDHLRKERRFRTAYIKANETVAQQGIANDRTEK